MFQKQIPVTTRLIEKLTDDFAEVSAIKKIAWLVSELSDELHNMPSLHVMEGAEGERGTLCVLFENSCFVCDELFAEYGEVIASIAKTYPMSVCGMLQNLEMGELTACFEADGMRYTKSNISGRDYDMLSSVYLKISIGEREEFDFAKLLLSDCARMSIAFPRRYKHLLKPEEYWGEKDLTHFLYLRLYEEGDFSQTLPEILSVAQLVELWVLFLNDGISAVEFDMIYEQIDGSESPCLLRLELALQLAMNELGIKINNGEAGFTVCKRNGERIRPDFLSAATAEKLFVKILFPAVRV